MTNLQKLSRMTASDSEPVLAVEDLDQLLANCGRPDAAGRPPTDLNWTPTYDLNAAAAEGWRWKAARAGELTSVDLDGTKLSAEQIFDHCERMIGVYSKKVNGTVPL
jgi:hypothetical protein